MRYCANPKHKPSGSPTDGLITKDEEKQGFTYCLRCRAQGYKDPGVKK
jgi:hypothetical protein